MAEVRETMRLKRLLWHGLQEIWCQMEVVLVACVVLLDVNACSGPCHPTTPTRIEPRHETRCEEATSTSLYSKKKEARKIEPPQINNECIEKALIQLTGVVKCILVVLVFFGLAFLVKFW